MGWDPTNMFNPATLCMYVPVPSQEPFIQWLSFAYVLHIVFCSEIRPIVFLFELFNIVISGPFTPDYAVWALLIVEGCTVTHRC